MTREEIDAKFIEIMANEHYTSEQGHSERVIVYMFGAIIIMGGAVALILLRRWMGG